MLLISPERLNNPRFRTEVLPSLAASVGPAGHRRGALHLGLGPRLPPRLPTHRRRARGPGGGRARCSPRPPRPTPGCESDVAAQIGHDTLTFRGSLDRPVPAPVGRPDRLGPGPTRLAGRLGARATRAPASSTASPSPRPSAPPSSWWPRASPRPPTPARRRRPNASGSRQRSTTGRCRASWPPRRSAWATTTRCLAYVVHLGSPSSPIAYYQQVGRAGRGRCRRAGGAGAHADRARHLGLLRRHGHAAGLHRRRGAVGAGRRGPVDAGGARGHGEPAPRAARGAAEGARRRRRGRPSRAASGSAPTSDWSYDTERYEQLAAARAAEQAAMREYQATAGCRLRFLREQLDDAGAEDCGRCDNCTGRARRRRGRRVDGRRGAAVPARGAGRARAPQAVAPWPGRPLGQHRRRPTGRSGSGARLRQRPRAGPRSSPRCSGGADAPPDDDLVRGVAAALKAWPWGSRPTWVTWVPSRTAAAARRGARRAARRARQARAGRRGPAGPSRGTPAGADGELRHPGRQRASTRSPFGRPTAGSPFPRARACWSTTRCGRAGP